MSKILLIRPASVFSKSSYSVPVTMPLSIAYLGANLLKHGHQVHVIDALGEGLDHISTSYSPHVLYRGLSNESILGRILEKPDAIGMTAMFSQDWPHIEETINRIHEKFPDTPIILGGEHATAASEYVLKTCPAVTYIALGEGEETLVEFADCLDGKKRIEGIAGIHYLSHKKNLLANPPRSRIRNIDDLPWPAWHLFSLEPYFKAGEGHGVERGRSMPILATRGCPYQCSFCSNPFMWTTRYVMRSTRLVADEIEHYLHQYQAKNIDFFDETAIIQKSWIVAFCQEIKRRDLKFTWQLPSGTRSEALDDEVLCEMASAGCKNITYAPESGSIKVLEEIKKKIKIPKMLASVRSAKKNQIYVKCNLIVGFPKETRSDIAQTLWLALRLACIGVDDAALYAYSPYPGSELYHYLRKTGAIGEMDRRYFETLMSFMDLKTSAIYCEKIGPVEIAFYRMVGMGLFYLLSYAFYPLRILRTLRNYYTRQSDTVFEERLSGFLKRRSLITQSRGLNKQSPDFISPA